MTDLSIDEVTEWADHWVRADGSAIVHIPDPTEEDQPWCFVDTRNREFRVKTFREFPVESLGRVCDTCLASLATQKGVDHPKR